MSMRRRFKGGFKVPGSWTPLPNCLVDDFLGVVSDKAFRVHLAIIRLTWGYQKKADAIALSQICEKARLPRRTVCRAIDELRKAGLLIVTGSTQKPRIYEPLSRRIEAESHAIAVAHQTTDLAPQLWHKTHATAMAPSIERNKQGPQLLK